MRLEYRLNENGNVIYYFENINESELRIRRLMYYYIQGNEVYSNFCSRKETDENNKEYFVIYLEKVEDEFVVDEITETSDYSIKVELREYIDDDTLSPLLGIIDDIIDHEYVLDTYILSDQIEYKGKWYNIKTKEMNEDEKSYILYIYLSEDQR